MDFIQPSKVTCHIWPCDIKSRSFKSCNLQVEVKQTWFVINFKISLSLNHCRLWPLLRVLVKSTELDVLYLVSCFNLLIYFSLSFFECLSNYFWSIWWVNSEQIDGISRTNKAHTFTEYIVESLWLSLYLNLNILDILKLILSFAYLISRNDFIFIFKKMFKKLVAATFMSVLD